MSSVGAEGQSLYVAPFQMMQFERNHMKGSGYAVYGQGSGGSAQHRCTEPDTFVLRAPFGRLVPNVRGLSSATLEEEVPSKNDHEVRNERNKVSSSPILWLEPCQKKVQLKAFIRSQKKGSALHIIHKSTLVIYESCTGFSFLLELC